MSEWYYTDFRRQQFGPYSGSELKEMNASGIINAETPVWREGQERWEPLRKHAGAAFDMDQLDWVVCAQNGKIIPDRESLPYGHVHVSVDAKNEFVQSLMETSWTAPPMAVEDGVRYIGFWWRLLAVILDEAVKLVVMTVVAIILMGLSALLQLSVFDSEFLSSTLGGILIFVGLLIAYGGAAFYEIWMVGKYQGTLGKMVIGAKVVNPDESRVSYLKSFGRWAAKSPISLEAAKLLPTLAFYLFIGLLAAGFSNGGPAFIVASWFLAMVLPILVTAAVSSVFWMAGFDPQKRALHDRLASTRVIAK